MCHECLKKRLTPNPNVLIELGFAINQLGFGKIICINNDSFGAVENLPFDIRQNRIARYELSSKPNLKEQKAKLKNILKGDLLCIVENYDNLGAEKSQWAYGAHDAKIFQNLQLIWGGRSFKNILEEMIDGDVHKSEYEILKETIAYIEREGNSFIDSELKKGTEKLLKKLETFRLAIASLGKICDHEKNDYYFELVRREEWRGSQEEYEKRRGDDYNLRWKSGMAVIDYYIEFRQKIKNKLVV